MVRLRELSTDQWSVRFGNDDSNSSSDRCAEVQRHRLFLVGRFGPMQHVLPRQLRRRRLGPVVRLLVERLQFGKEVGSTSTIRFKHVIDFRFSIRSRSATTSPSCGGNWCPALSESKDCTGLQKIDCVMGSWSTWSSCSNRCGAGQEKRYRGVTQSAQCGGASCGASDASRPCTSYADDRDCTVRPESIFQYDTLITCCIVHQVSAWGSWSSCSAQCAVGSRERSRTVILTKRCRGQNCPSLKVSS